jgi:hypothetical protein
VRLARQESQGDQGAAQEEGQEKVRKQGLSVLIKNNSIHQKFSLADLVWSQYINIHVR